MRRGSVAIAITSANGESARLEVITVRELAPRGVDTLLAKRLAGKEACLVYARFLSATTRTRLAEAGISYGDTTGNWRVELSSPGLFLRTDGATKDPNPPRRPLLSLKGPAAGRVVRALCDLTPPYGVRELAERAEIPLGTLSRVVGLLDEAALIEREPRSPILEVAVAELIERWTEDYRVLDSNRASNWLAPRGLPSVLEQLARLKGRIAVTGSFGAAPVVQVSPAKLMMAYAPDASALAKRLKLVPAEAGANVILLEPFDECVFERTWRHEDLPIVRHSQLAADLLTSPGRSPEEGEALLRWMENHQGEWRDRT